MTSACVHVQSFENLFPHSLRDVFLLRQKHGVSVGYSSQFQNVIAQRLYEKNTCIFWLIIITHKGIFANSHKNRCSIDSRQIERLFTKSLEKNVSSEAL